MARKTPEIVTSIRWSDLDQSRIRLACAAAFEPFGSLFGGGSASPEREALLDAMCDQNVPAIERALEAHDGERSTVQILPPSPRGSGVEITTPTSGTSIQLRRQPDGLWRLRVAFHFSVERARRIVAAAERCGVAPNAVRTVRPEAVLTALEAGIEDPQRRLWEAVTALRWVLAAATEGWHDPDGERAQCWDETLMDGPQMDAA